MTTCHTPETIQKIEHGTDQKSWETQNRDHGSDRRTGCECDCAWVCWRGVSRTRLPVPLLTTRTPWDPQLSWTWQTSCDGKTLFSFGARYAEQADTGDDTKCKESVQNWDGRLLVRILWLWHLMLRHLGLVVLFFEEVRVCFSRVCICAELWRGRLRWCLKSVPAMKSATCGQRKDVCSLCIGADDVGPCCCVVTHRGDVPHRVVGPAHDEVAHASNAVGDAGNVVGMVLDFPPNVTCRVPSQGGSHLSGGWHTAVVLGST